MALIAGGVSVELFSAAQAPLSGPDERNLPLGAPAHEVAEEFQSGNPS
ncbi:MAG TPA: hypothetical protein VNT26_01725 [Candidatus Sulfotelmatobacter sp.]|nr:hypothetical protein [Candidatus Sulfotelmatobacter sp.]